jgi:hypothetical protein
MMRPAIRTGLLVLLQVGVSLLAVGVIGHCTGF